MSYLSKEASGEDESEYESDSDEYSEDDGQIMKPIFVPKQNRITIQLKEAQAEEEKRLIEKKQVQKAKKKEQTVELLAESIRKDAELQDNHLSDADSDAGLPDDTDNLDQDLDFEEWKIREMTRLKRDHEEKEAHLEEKRDLIRRRNMTDEERLQEDILSGKVKVPGGEEDGDSGKPKWKFMQKYFHKGAFYMDEDSLAKSAHDVRKKDYAAEPTLEDKVDKEKLPQVLQVKNFGKRGRTKYTHLLDQDTTVQRGHLTLSVSAPVAVDRGGAGSGGSNSGGARAGFEDGAVGEDSDRPVRKRARGDLGRGPDKRLLTAYMNKRSGMGKI